MEIGRMVAESYYRKGNNEALLYLVDYERNSRNVAETITINLVIAITRLRSLKRLFLFSKVHVLRMMSYPKVLIIIWRIVTRKRMPREVRERLYQSAAQSSFDTEIQEESQFNFAKLSYELSYQSVAIEAIRNFTTSFPKSAHLDEANELMVGIYTNTRNYKDALTSIEAIKNKTQPIRAAYQKVAYYRGIEFFHG